MLKALIIIAGMVAVAWFFYKVFAGRPAAANQAKTPAPRVSVNLDLSALIDGFHDELPQDAIAFEAGLMASVGPKIDKHFYTKLVGVTFDNEDGTSRQELIAKCKEFQPVYLNVQPDDLKYPEAIRVTVDLPGPTLGYLDARAGAQISDDILKCDRVWGGLVRVVSRPSSSTPYGMVVCVMRFKPEFEEPYRMYSKRTTA